jgi:hypothetical protein
MAADAAQGRVGLLVLMTIGAQTFLTFVLVHLALARFAATRHVSAPFSYSNVRSHARLL